MIANFLERSFSSREEPRGSEATFGTIRNDNKAFLTNSVTLQPNGKLFDHEKWFLTYLAYIEEYTKIMKISTHWFFTGVRVCAGCVQIWPSQVK